MKAFILKLLGAHKGEGGRVTILLVMSFFMGVFLATIGVASQSLFLTHWTDKSALPLALLASGAFGVIATLLYNFLQNRIPFQLLSTLSLIIILIITAVLEFGEKLFTDLNTVYFLGFTQILPFTFITYLVFWGSFGRMFNLRQAKRLVGTVDLGAMIASFLGYFGILLWSNYNIPIDRLYTISLVSISVYLGLYLVLSFLYLNRARTFVQEKKMYKKLGMKDFFKNRYIVYMSLFVIVSMMSISFVDYSFLTVTTQYFDSSKLAVFLSSFEMSVVIFSFLFEVFGADRIMEEYGMRISLLINPLLIFGITAIALALGLVFGYSPKDQFFIGFFIGISMSKLFISSLRETLDQPTFKLYLLPIEISTRIDVQTKIEGLVTAFAMLLGAGFIYLINQIEFFSIIYVTIFTIPLLAIWYFVTSRMHSSYRQTLQNTLLSNKEKSNRKEEKQYTVNKVLENEVNSSAEAKVIYGLKLMEKLEPALFENTVIRLTDSSNLRIKTFAEAKVKLIGIEKESDIKSLANQARGEVEDNDILSISPENLLKLSKSIKQNDRVLASKLLRKLISTKTIFVLLELLRDPDPKVRYEALVTARRVKRQETWSVLIEMLGSPSYGHHAAAALKEAGESVLPTLEAAFHKSGQTDLVMLRIVQVMGRIGGNYALQLLWRKADYPDKRIVKQILFSLRFINYRATGREAREVLNLLETEISKTIWNLASITELPEGEDFKYLREALNEEVADNYDQIIMLLSIIYDPESVQLVRENLESGEPDSIAFAMELLDLFIDQELKPKLFPLLDQTSTQHKLETLQLFYPRENYTAIQSINYILNRDFNLNNRWTKACAIHATAYMSDFRISRGLVAQVFNTDKLLQETAAWVVYNKDKSAYEAITERLPEKDKKFIGSSIENNQLLDGLDDGFFLWIEKVLFIKQLPAFSGIHGSLICDLADKIIPLDLDRGEVVRFNPEDHNTPIFIVAHGEVKLRINDILICNLKKGGLYGDIFIEGAVEKANMIEALERSVVFQINIMDFYFVMANHHELVQGLIKNISTRKNYSNINQ
ncbi:MAG TPA: cyclic nucleotide-binding domain-containing protein [Cyclobacteriaceae bacterium]|nr:cyclic nucleotide-binding domain-containing protein [Cyclobacteriaceae bacterium]